MISKHDHAEMRPALPWVLAALLLIQHAFVLAAGSAAPQPPSKSACVDSVQGRVISAGNDKHWTAANLARLCKGAETTTAPGKCYQRLMAGEVDYGSGTHWLRANALKLCGGAHDADARIGCFEGRIGLGVAWPAAIEQCVSPPSASTCSTSAFSSAALCGDACVDLRDDPRNCGRCGNQCNATLACRAGVCVPQPAR